MLIIFDCDGVLVDSEILSSHVFSQTLKNIGISFSSQECMAQFQGWALPACYAWLEKRFDVALPASFDHTLSENTRMAFERDLSAVDGVKTVLDDLTASGIPFCVASNGSHKKIQHSLSLTKLLPYFSSRFSVEDVSNGKPAPDLFLHAAKKMGMPAAQTIVIEDSKSGWLAAEAAGMQSLIYAPHERPNFSCAHWFSTMDALPSLLKRAENVCNES